MRSSLVGVPASSGYWTKLPGRQSSDRVDPVHGLLMRRGPSPRRYRKHRSKRGAAILSTMALGAQTVTAVASQVEHADVVLMYVFSYSSRGPAAQRSLERMRPPSI